MSRLFYHVMQDNVGNLLFDVSGTMRLAGTGTLATIYGDEALTVILPNPMTNHPSFGSFKCFLGPGDYDFYMAKAGYTFETLTGVQGWSDLAQQAPSNVAITGGVITGLANLTVGGTTQLGVTGIGEASQPTLWLVTGTGASVLHRSPVAINQNLVNPGLGLEVTGTTRLNGQVGIGEGPNQTFGLTVGGQTLLAGNVAIGDATLPNNYNLRVNGTSMFTGPLNASAVAITGGNVTGLGSLSAGALTVTSTAQIANLGLGVAPEAGYILSTSGSFSKFNGFVGMGMTPATFWLCAFTAGKPGGGAWSDTSDVSLKTAIGPIDNALALLTALEGHRYEWQEETHRRALPGPQYGLIAQEVETVIPQWVGETEDGLKTLSITGFEALTVEAMKQLVGALQTLAAQVETLTARVAALEDAASV